MITCVYYTRKRRELIEPKGYNQAMRMVVALAPLILLELVLLVVALVDLVRRPKVTGGNKVIWLIVILFISTLGPIIYLIFGRKEGK